MADSRHTFVFRLPEQFPELLSFSPRWKGHLWFRATKKGLVATEGLLVRVEHCVLCHEEDNVVRYGLNFCRGLEFDW